MLHTTALEAIYTIFHKYNKIVGAVQVLASLDSTPALETPMPGKLIPAVAAAGGDGHVHKAADVLKEVHEMEQQLGKEVKVSMQSHFE